MTSNWRTAVLNCGFELGEEVYILDFKLVPTPHGVYEPGNPEVVTKVVKALVVTNDRVYPWMEGDQYPLDFIHLFKTRAEAEKEAERLNETSQ